MASFSLKVSNHQYNFPILSRMIKVHRITVKQYMFSALCVMNYPLLKSIINMHKNLTNSFPKHVTHYNFFKGRVCI